MATDHRRCPSSYLAIALASPSSASPHTKMITARTHCRNIWPMLNLDIALPSTLLLSRFSHLQLCATPEMAAHQAPPSLGFCRQEHEWVAISFSNAWKWKVKVNTLSHVRFSETPWTAAHQAPPSMGFSRQEYWSEVSSPSPSILLGMCILYRDTPTERNNFRSQIR